MSSFCNGPSRTYTFKIISQYLWLAWWQVSADYNKLFFSFGMFFLFFFSFPYFLLFHWSIPSLFSSPCPTNLSIFPHLSSLSSIRSSTPLSYMYLSTVLLLPFRLIFSWPFLFLFKKVLPVGYLQFFYIHGTGLSFGPLNSGRPILLSVKGKIKKYYILKSFLRPNYWTIPWYTDKSLHTFPPCYSQSPRQVCLEIYVIRKKEENLMENHAPLPMV